MPRVLPLPVPPQVPPVPVHELHGMPNGEPSAAIRARVVAAREVQKRRFAGMEGVHCNAQIRSRDLAAACGMSAADAELFRKEMRDLDLSARAYDRVMKVARTIADLAGSERVTFDHLYEASGYRTMDRRFWA